MLNVIKVCGIYPYIAIENFVPISRDKARWSPKIVSFFSVFSAVLRDITQIAIVLSFPAMILKDCIQMQTVHMIYCTPQGKNNGYLNFLLLDVNF